MPKSALTSIYLPSLVAFFGPGLALSYFGWQGFALAIWMVAAVILFLLPLEKSILLLFVYVGFEGFLKIISDYHPLVHVGVDILVVLLFTRLILLALHNKNEKLFERPPFTAIFILHFAWFAICILNPFALSLFSSLAAAKMYVTMPLLYFFGYWMTRSRVGVEKVMVVWTLITAVHVAFSLYQSSHGPSSVLSIHHGYATALQKFSTQAFRPFGLTAIPGGPAVFIFLTIPFVVYFLIESKGMLARLFHAILIPACIMTLLVCQVRSALIKSIIGTGAFVFYSFFWGIQDGLKIKLQRGLVFALMAGFTAYVLPPVISSLISKQTDNSIAIERSMTTFNYSKMQDARVGNWSRLVTYAQEIPLGAGLSRTGAAAGAFKNLLAADPYFGNRYFSDNLFLACLVDLGIPGLLIFITLIVSILSTSLLRLNRIVDPQVRMIAALILCALVSCALGSYGAEGILYNPEASFFWFFSGTLMRLTHGKIS